MSEERPDVELGELVDALLAEPRFATGELPPLRPVTVEESLTVLDDIHAGTDGASELLPGLAKQLGKEIACREGCAGCCESLVLVWEPEALRIASELNKPERRAVRDRVLARLGAWNEQCGDRARAAADALSVGDLGGYVQRMGEHALSHSMCPFNTNDRCEIYDVRPLPCRKPWALDTSEHCRASSDPEAPKALLLTSRSHEDLYARARRVLAGLQNAMGRGTSAAPLPSVVLRLMNETDTTGDDDT